jgi:hypothetical protein
MAGANCRLAAAVLHRTSPQRWQPTGTVLGRHPSSTAVRLTDWHGQVHGHRAWHGHRHGMGTARHGKRPGAGAGTGTAGAADEGNDRCPERSAYAYVGRPSAGATRRR